MFTYSTFTFSPGDLMARRLNAWCAYDPRMQRQPPPIRPAVDGSQAPPSALELLDQALNVLEEGMKCRLGGTPNANTRWRSNVENSQL